MHTLDNYAIYQVHGAQATKFLQGQLTTDVGAMQSHTAALTAHCNPQGRIIANFFLCCTSQTEFLLAVRKDTADLLHTSLKKYALFSNVAIDIAAGGMVAEICHSEHQQSISAIFQCPAPIKNYALAYSKTPFTPQGNWQQILIKHGIAMIDANTSGQYTPHAIGLDRVGGVNFQKGCYTGQEIIARMHFRATPKDGLYHATCQHQQMPNTHTSLVNPDDNKVGSILSIAPSANGFELLINLRHAAASNPVIIKDLALVLEVTGQVESIIK